MKTYLVHCEVHGEYEVTPNPKNESQECPTHCPITNDGRVCGISLTRRYSIPTIHYKGEGWAGKGS
jgi:hypothetical protein